MSSEPLPTAEDPADSTRPRALLTGLSGQDGSFLAELLLQKGYEVAALVHGEQGRSLGCAEHLRERVLLLAGDLLDLQSLRAGVREFEPREIYHLAAPSFIPDSWLAPEQTLRAIVSSSAALLEGALEARSETRLFIAASGAMFGRAPGPQSEDTPCHPTTPYAIAKLAAHQLVGVLRERHGLYACSGIVFNHESERRPERFVTRRITRAAAAISLGLRDELTLGDLGAIRDWSFAGDIVRGAWMMLQQEQAVDYVLASGVAHTVEQFAQAAFGCVGLEAERYLRVDGTLRRPNEDTVSVGDPTRARTRLGWEPELSFQELVARMVTADLQDLQRGDRP
ncbi:MAG TPA: GDP-mannose 4,6-dehydratase [Solirubrobacteraceae bacterium]|jgi:GDPmannose 4,6-dehydratase